MKKSTKAALAAAGAGVLLTGGAGTLAFWNATGTIDGSTITASTLTITPVDCSDWVLDGDEIVAGADLDLIVPGDVVTKICTYTIGATGEHLRATLAAEGGEASGDLVVNVTPTFEVDDATVTEITDANDGSTLTATIEVEFPYGASVDNGSQGDTVDLSDYVVTATQVHN